MHSDRERERLLVIISTVAVDAWLDEAVESVLAQLEHGDRLLVRHDGVPSDPERGWTRHPAVTITQAAQRSGIGRALAESVPAGDEPLIARLDADDIAYPGRFAAQRHYLAENRDVVLVASMARLIDGEGRVIGDYRTQPGVRIRHRLIGGNPIVQSTVMFRRSAYDVAGGYNPDVRHFEDYDLWLRLGRVGEVTILSEFFAGYRLHPSQATRTVGVLGAPLEIATRGQFALGAELGLSTWQIRRRRAHWWVVQYGMTAKAALHRRRAALASRERPRG